MGESSFCWRLATACGLLIGLWAGQLLAPPSGRADHARVPEPNPPVVDQGEVGTPATAAVERRTAAATEWTYHKTSDGLHPDGNEQQFVWLMNRARSDPAQEGIWLATMDDPDVAAARAFFSVDGSVLQNEFSGYAAKPPAAFDARLYQAAKAHSDYLIRMDEQNHDNQITRITDAGFNYSRAASIVFSYSDHTIFGYAGFNIDWGNGSAGTQDPPGHRFAIMSLSGNYTNAGIAVVPESAPETAVGPQVISGNLCEANTGFPDHYNRFIVGTVWEDTNSNDQYDPGEGLADVTVMPDKGAFFAVTGNSGGYAIPITAADDYRLTFSGGHLTGVFTRTVTVGSASVLQDLEYFAASAANPADSDGGSSAGEGGADSSGGGGGGGGCMIGAAAKEDSGTTKYRAALSIATLMAGLVFFVFGSQKMNRR